jgi:hypothetical protein
MPKAGRFDFPKNDLDDCIERVKKIHTTAKQDAVKREVASEILGMAPKSGWFNTLIGSMTHYGLIQVGDGDVKITELAKTVIYGDAQEVAKAKEEAVKNVDLFRELLTQYGAGITDDQIRIFLRQKAYVDVAEVQSLAEELGKLLKSMARYVATVDTSGQASNQANPPSAGGRDMSRPVFTSGAWTISTDTYGEIRVVDSLSAEYAIKLLERKKDELETKEKPPTTSTKTTEDTTIAKTEIQGDKKKSS